VKPSDIFCTWVERQIFLDRQPSFLKKLLKKCLFIDLATGRSALGNILHFEASWACLLNFVYFHFKPANSFQFVDEVFEIVLHATTLAKRPFKLDGEAISLKFDKLSCHFWASISVVYFYSSQNGFGEISAHSAFHLISLGFQDLFNYFKVSKTQFARGITLDCLISLCETVVKQRLCARCQEISIGNMFLVSLARQLEFDPTKPKT